MRSSRFFTPNYELKLLFHRVCHVPPHRGHIDLGVRVLARERHATSALPRHRLANFKPLELRVIQHLKLNDFYRAAL